jgi:hypothetical protein
VTGVTAAAHRPFEAGRRSTAEAAVPLPSRGWRLVHGEFWNRAGRGHLTFVSGQLRSQQRASEGAIVGLGVWRGRVGLGG